MSPAPLAAAAGPFPPAVPTDDPAAARFRRGAAALFPGRCALLTFLAAAALVPPVAQSLGLAGGAGLLPIGLFASAAGARLLLPGRHARMATFASLCLDALALVHLAVASGGLFSPLLAGQIALVAATAHIFEGRAALAPALLVPPLAALLQPAPPAAADLFLLAWYGALDLAAVVAMRSLRRSDEAARAAEDRLAAALREKAVLEERTRLAREIHDGVGASLAALVLQAELAARSAPGGGAVAELRATAEDAIEELRRSVRMLRDDFDLLGAAEAHCARFARRAGLAVRFAGSGAADLAPAAQLALFRVLQEALHNALRHAGARTVEVTLALSAAGARLVVRDDGRGFDPERTPTGHYGLRGMGERARACGGTLEIRSAPGAGAAIEMRLPARGAPPGEEER